MCVRFSLKTNYFEIRFNSLSLKPESSIALGVSVESPPPCQKGIMKCQRGWLFIFLFKGLLSLTSFILLDYPLLGPTNIKEKETLLPFFHHFTKSHLHDLLFDTVAQLGTCTSLPLTVLHEMYLSCTSLS